MVKMSLVRINCDYNPRTKGESFSLRENYNSFQLYHIKYYNCKFKILFSMYMSGGIPRIIEPQQKEIRVSIFYAKKDIERDMRVKVYPRFALIF